MGPGRKTSNLKININAEPLHRGTLVWLYGIPIAIDKSPLMLSSLLKVTKKKLTMPKAKARDTRDSRIKFSRTLESRTVK